MQDNTILHEFVKELKQNGFKVFTSAEDKNYSYCHFIKDDKIGYVQTDYFGGLSFSTVHKPCKGFGTGFGLNDLNNRVWQPTIKDAEKCFITAPNWATGNIGDIKKYKNWDEYINTPINKILTEREL